MANLDAKRLISLYFEADRSEVERRYKTLFAIGGAQADAEPGREGATKQKNGKASKDSSESSPTRQRAQSAIGGENAEPDNRDHLEAWINACQPSVELADRLRTQWRFFDEHAKDFAYYYLDRFDDSKTTVAYVLEGLFWFWGPSVATQVMHTVVPDLIFPIEIDQRYDRLKALFNVLGIQFDDTASLPPVELILRISDAIQLFRQENGLTAWQAWALVYDLAPRLLEQPSPYASGGSRVWVTAAGEHNFEQVDAHDPSDEDTWTTNKRVRRGDILLMYCLRPRSAIVAAYRAAVDAYQDPLDAVYSGVFTVITDKLALPPITLQEMKKDPVLKSWSLVKTHFTGLQQHSVPDDVWMRIKEVVTGKNAETGRLLEDYGRSVEGVRTLRTTTSEITEKEFEDRTVVPILDKLGWRSGETLHRQFEMLIKVGSGKPKLTRADFVGFAGSLGGKATMVVETKRRIASEQDLSFAVQQCESYAGRLRCTRFAVASPQGIWVYELRFPGQSGLLTRHPVDPSDVEEAARRLMQVLGRNELLKL
jgi:hypothetical protein